MTRDRLEEFSLLCIDELGYIYINACAEKVQLRKVVLIEKANSPHNFFVLSVESRVSLFTNGYPTG